MRWKKPVIAASAVAMMAVAACGGGGSSTTENPTNQPSGPSGAAGKFIDMSAKAPAAPIPGATKGGTMTVMSALGATTMDPTEAYYTNTSSILEAYVTRSLTQYEYRNGDMVLIPDLASSWESNSDYTKWTFTIRDGIKYENGDPVTLEDIKYGIMRSFDRDTFPTGADYSNQYFKDGATYKGPYASNADYKGVQISGNKLTILMARPFPDMPYWGSFPAIGPIPGGDASNPATYKNHPLATGPYKFADYQQGVSLTLVRNDQWDPNTDPGRRQYPDEIDFTFTDETATIDQTMLSDSGTAQTSLTYDNVAAADYPTAVEQAPDRLVKGTTPCTAMWLPDMRKITDINIRKALGYAYPYEAAWKAGGDIVGVTKIPGVYIMPPGTPGQGTAPYDVLGNKGSQPDTAKAKQILTQANKLHYEIKFLYVRGDDLAEAAKDQIVKSLTASGFKATPVAVGVNQYTTVRADPNADINLRSFGWCSDWPSGASWFPPIFKTVPGGEAGPANYGFFSEPSVDKKIATIATLPLDQQPDAWGALDKYIETTYYPAVVVGYYGDVFMHGSKIGGMENDTVFGMPTWKQMWVMK
jgi:peptide/nickel transport system substrate-binding protein